MPLLNLSWLPVGLSSEFVGMLCLAVLVLASGILSYLATDFLCRWAHKNGRLLDYPNVRSSHYKITVRGGGIVFVMLALGGWLAATQLLDLSYGGALCIGAALIAGVGLTDDLYRIGVGVRLGAQFIAACIFLSVIPVPVLFLDLGPNAGAALWFIAAAFFLVSVTNIYNFMDGADGLATLHSVILLLGWTLLASRTEDGAVLMTLSLSLLAPLGGFLVLNWNPARIFMGDVGSTFLGFTFGALAVVQFPGVLRSSTFSLVILMMLPFLFDASFTILQRVFSGQRWYQAHKDHLFQRLLRKGYSHPQVALIYAGITLILAAVGLSAERLIFNEFAATALCCAPLLALYLWATSGLPRNRPDPLALANSIDRPLEEIFSETKQQATILSEVTTQ